VFEGQTLMVQVIKDPIGTKGARLSTQISIAGRLLVFLPQDDHIGVSQKIGAEPREQLRSAQTLVGEAARRRGGGFILRTNAEDASDAELAETSPTCASLGRDPDAAAASPPAGTAARGPEPGRSACCATWSATTTRSIRIDSREQFDALPAPSAANTRPPQRCASCSTTRASGRCSTCSTSTRRSRRRWAPRRPEVGGYLIIDQTEALTTVDVNTGGFVGARNFDDTIFKTNLEAAQPSPASCACATWAASSSSTSSTWCARSTASRAGRVRKQLARDRTKTTVGGFTQLGLVEMTRKRTRESLAHMLCEPCPPAQAAAHREDRAHRVLRHPARDPARGAPVQPKEFRVVASAAVIDLLLDEEPALAGCRTSSASRSRCRPRALWAGAVRHRAACRAGSGTDILQVMFIGRLPAASSITTGPHARYGSALRSRTNS
jgi:ribonuclease G